MVNVYASTVAFNRVNFVIESFKCYDCGDVYARRIPLSQQRGYEYVELASGECILLEVCSNCVQHVGS